MRFLYDEKSVTVYEDWYTRGKSENGTWHLGAHTYFVLGLLRGKSSGQGHRWRYTANLWACAAVIGSIIISWFALYRNKSRDGLSTI